MSVHASKKKETKAVFLNIAQELVKDINNYVSSQKNFRQDVVLNTFLSLATNGYMYATKANNIKIQSLDTFCRRTEYFIESQDCFRSLTDYLDVVVASHEVKEKRQITWSVQIDKIVSAISGVRAYDLEVAQKSLGDVAFTKKEIKEVVSNYQAQGYRDRLAYRRKIAIKSIDELLTMKIDEQMIDKLLGENLHDYLLLSQTKKKITSLSKDKNKKKRSRGGKSKNKAKDENASNGKQKNNQEVDNEGSKEIVDSKKSRRLPDQETKQDVKTDNKQ